MSHSKIANTFNPLPSKDLQQKMDYYYLPYTSDRERSLFLEFGDEESPPPDQQDDEQYGEKLRRRLFDFVMHGDPRLKKHLI